MRLPRLVVPAVLLAAFAGMPAAPAAAQETLKMNISVAQNSHYGVAVETFAREVEKRTNGRYKVQNFYAGALGAERESIEGVQLGTLDLTLTSTGPIPNFVPEVAILDIPVPVSRLRAGARRARRPDRTGDCCRNFRPRASSRWRGRENGFRHMTNSKRPVNAPDDLRGLKMRTMENPIHIQAYKQFGILPTPMAFTEVYTALQQGTVDGQENPLSVITAAKLDQVQKNLTLTGHVYSPALILMNKAQVGQAVRGRQAGLPGSRKGSGQGQSRAHRRGRGEGGRRSSRQGDADRGERRQGEIPGGADTGLRRLRQAFRPGKHRPDQELQVRSGEKRYPDRRATQYVAPSAP